MEKFLPWDQRDEKEEGKMKGTGPTLVGLDHGGRRPQAKDVGRLWEPDPARKQGSQPYTCQDLNSDNDWQEQAKGPSPRVCRSECSPRTP